MYIIIYDFDVGDEIRITASSNASYGLTILENGGAEPCPFSPYSDVNVRSTSLREAMRSPLFTALRNGDLLTDDHEGGCVLHEKRKLVEKLLADSAKLS